jgi:hypothetical protein
MPKSAADRRRGPWRGDHAAPGARRLVVGPTEDEVGETPRTRTIIMVGCHAPVPSAPSWRQEQLGWPSAGGWEPTWPGRWRWPTTSPQGSSRSSSATAPTCWPSRPREGRACPSSYCCTAGPTRRRGSSEPPVSSTGSTRAQRSLRRRSPRRAWRPRRGTPAPAVTTRCGSTSTTPAWSPIRRGRRGADGCGRHPGVGRGLLQRRDARLPRRLRAAGSAGRVGRRGRGQARPLRARW